MSADHEETSWHRGGHPLGSKRALGETGPEFPGREGASAHFERPRRVFAKGAAWYHSGPDSSTSRVGVRSS